MRVKLCARCPYGPRDLADHYDPEAAAHLCASCDGEQEASINHYPRKAYRRGECATAPNVFGSAQQSVARSATKGLASSGTIPGEPPSVQRSALIASRPAGKATADGYVDFKRPDNGCSEHHAAFSQRCPTILPLAVQPGGLLAVLLICNVFQCKALSLPGAGCISPLQTAVWPDSQ